MQGRIFMWGSALVGITAGLGACYGTMDGAGEADLATQSFDLVSSKRDWLKNYDGHCSACFQAFSLCEKGVAAEPQQADVCQVALEACVRGGLANQDGGVDDAGVDDDADVNFDDDADVDDDANADDGLNDDAGAEVDDAGAVDLGGQDAGSAKTGRRRSHDVDASNDTGDLGAVDAGIVDVDAGDVVNVGNDANKQKLVDDVNACLDQTRICVDQNTDDAAPCVQAIETCVEAALEGVFEAICAEQLQTLDAHKTSKNEKQRVQSLCDQDLGL